MKVKELRKSILCPKCEVYTEAKYRGQKRRGDMIYKSYRGGCGHLITDGGTFSKSDDIKVTETKEWTPVQTSDDLVEAAYGFNSAEIAILNGTSLTIESVRETQPQFSERYTKELRGKGLEVTEMESQMAESDTTETTWDAVPAVEETQTITPSEPRMVPEAEIGAVERQRAILDALISELDKTEYEMSVDVLDQDDPPLVSPVRAASTKQRPGDYDIFAWANIVPKYHPEIVKNEFLSQQAASRSYPFLGRAAAMIRRIVTKNSGVPRNERAWADDRLSFIIDMEIGGTERAVEFHCRRDHDDKGFMRLFKIGIFKEGFNLNDRTGSEDSLYGRINKAKGRLWFLEQQEGDDGVLAGNSDHVLPVDESPF